MTDLQSAIESAERRFQQAMDQADDDLAMGLIDVRERRLRLDAAEENLRAEISFAHVVADMMENA